MTIAKILIARGIRRKVAELNDDLKIAYENEIDVEFDVCGQPHKTSPVKLFVYVTEEIL